MIFWLLSESIPGPAEELPEFLAPPELTTLAAKRFSKRRSDWLHGRWAAKQLLQQCHPNCVGLNLAQIIIETESSGAPFARTNHGENLPGCLSITHSGPLAAAALTLDPGLEVGIDLESIEIRPVHLFETYFTDFENNFIRGDGTADPSIRLAGIWSAKEAVLKAMRIGLAMDTRKLEVRPQIGGKAELSSTGWTPFDIDVQVECIPPARKKLTGDETWQGWQRTLAGYVLSIAVICRDRELCQRLEGQVPFQVG